MPIKLSSSKKTYEPNQFIRDDGSSLFAPRAGALPEDPFGMKMFGQQQTELRRGNLREEQAAAQTQWQAPFGPLKNASDSLGLLPNPTEDAFFGLLTAKENAAQRGGKTLRVTPNSAFANDGRKSTPGYGSPLTHMTERSRMTGPTTAAPGQESLNGIMQAIEGSSGDLNADIRHKMWMDAERGRGRSK